MAPSDGKSPQRPKRRKVAESCKLCRAKKTRCDGQRPVCSSCREKAVRCEYNDATVPVSTSTLLDIDLRLRKLEEQATSSSTQTIVPKPVGSGIPSNSTPRSQLLRPNQGNPNTDTGDPEPGTWPFADNPTTQFIQDITQIADFQFSGQLPHALLHGESDEAPVETDMTSMVVPRRAVADDLLECYERLVYPLFPILHMPTFRKSYMSLWDSEKPSQFKNLAAEATFHASLNIVFALGSLNSLKTESCLKLRTAEVFYRRARKIMPLDALDSVSLGVVQYLLLTTTYLSFTKYVNRCWNTLAVAMRVSHTLGLHMDVESSSQNQLRREMSRRLWHICLALERLFSSIFGRKIMFKADNIVPLPAKVDDEYLREDGIGIQPTTSPPILDAFITTINIFEIIEHAQRIKYDSLTHGLRLPELTEVLQLNEKVDQIERNLPSYLRCSNEAKSLTPREQVLRLQADGVKARLLHLRLVLLRPNVLAAARQSLLMTASRPQDWGTQTALEATLRSEVSNICVRAAISAIMTLHMNLQLPSRIFSSIAVFMTLSAATVIIAASMVSEFSVSLEDGSGPYKDAIAKAFQVLDGHMWQIEGAPSAKDLLEKFLETVNRENRRRNYENQTLILSEGGQNPGMENNIEEFDFSDPLWTFQWGSSTPLFDMTRPYFDYP
ncbi:putative transcriptional regulatory protein [Xylariaceae sp. AK1471]|nr:putative transcriptional regulatory protein [Xylariaceae sp. AK1471]